MEQLKQAKEQCLADIEKALPRYEAKMNDIDRRLMLYVTDALSNHASHANLYELLGIRKTLRLMDSYTLNVERVVMHIRAIEGVWKDGRHVQGSLKFDTPRGNQHVQLMPFQVWCLFGIFAFDVDISMERAYIPGEQLLPSEYVVDGQVWDCRRLTVEAHLFITRKSGKTELGGALDFTHASVLGPVNAQVLICANSREQAKIAYKAIKDFAIQIDPTCLNRLGGKYFRLTADELNWQPNQPRKGEIKVMSAGGKKKDGLYGSWIHADEHGQSPYINGHSDMQDLVNVCVGSMGPRREPMTLHTTTAGHVTEGPYKNQIETVERLLLKELDYPLGQPHRTPEDKWFAFLLRLDPWETNYDLDQLDNPELFKKVNRSIGITVQPNWYKERLHEARKDDDVKKEVLTKDFNIWQTGRVTQWVKGDRIRQLQTSGGRRIDDCKFTDEEGRERWHVFCGMDFSQGDDLFAITYMAVDWLPSNTMKGRFFVDTDAWVLESTMQASPNKELYEEWVKAGWLHVCPGEVFDSTHAINRIADLARQGVNFYYFGYDPAQSLTPINNLKAWLQTLFSKRVSLTSKDIASAIQRMVVPVSQSAMTQNPRIGELEEKMLGKDEWMQFSDNPLWPWCFGNCAIETGTSELRRIIKGGPQPTHKVDPVHALLDALYCFDLSEGRMETN